MIKLGDKELKSKVMLAPMAGLTDVPFRKIVREFGDFLVFSEMVASQAVIRNIKRTFKMMEREDDEWTAVQIVGADPMAMAEAAKLSEDLGANFLDINMGCPVKKVVKSESGSALMKNEKLAAEILRAVVSAVNISVSLKMRLGWDSENKNATSIAKIAEDSGIKMITVHGRTRSQLYSGKADWLAIKEVKDSVRIPVIANGDIISIDSAKQALRESNADGLMIGRGALGSPWLLRDIHNVVFENENQTEISIELKHNLIRRHIGYILDFYPDKTAIKICIKTLMYYCKCIDNACKLRNNLTSISSYDELNEFINTTFPL